MPPLPPTLEPYRHTLGFMVANLNLNIVRLEKMVDDTETGTDRRKQLRDLAYRLSNIRDEIAQLDS